MAFDWNKWRIRFNTAGYSCWHVGRKYSIHWRHRLLTDQDLWVISEGRGRILLADGDAELCAGRVVWMRPGHYYEVEQQPDNPLKIHWFHFDMLDAENRLFFPEFDEIPEYFHSGDNMNVMLLARTLFRIFRSFQARGASADTGRQLILAQQLRVILMLVAADMIPGRPPAAGLRNSDIARQAAWFLDEVSDRITPVTELAGKFHLSRNQFTRIFHSFWGISPSEYQIRSRMNQAKYLLSSTDLSIRDIAAELGYADHYFFARQFKQKTGVTPGKFRDDGHPGEETVS